MYCSGEFGGENDGKKGQGGVGLAVRNSITRAARPPEFISDHLLKVTLELRGRAKAVTFVVAYAPTEPQNANNCVEARRGRRGQTSPGEERGNETGKVAIAHGSVEFCEATPIGLADES